MKFLVVDDHELIREAMRGALKQLDGDAAILEAADSRQAMLLIDENADLDLILLDLNLPDRDGFSVLVELRRNYPSISVVVMSAQQDHDSVVKALKLGALQLVMSGGTYIPPQALPSEQPSTMPTPAPTSLAEPEAGGDKVSRADLGLTERQIEVL